MREQLIPKELAQRAFPDGNYFSPDGGKFTAKDAILYWEDGDTSDTCGWFDEKGRQISAIRFVPMEHGTDYSAWSPEFRAVVRKNHLQMSEGPTQDPCPSQKKSPCSTDDKDTALYRRACEFLVTNLLGLAEEMGAHGWAVKKKRAKWGIVTTDAVIVQDMAGCMAIRLAQDIDCGNLQPVPEVLVPATPTSVPDPTSIEGE